MIIKICPKTKITIMNCDDLYVGQILMHESPHSTRPVPIVMIVETKRSRDVAFFWLTDDTVIWFTTPTYFIGWTTVT